MTRFGQWWRRTMRTGYGFAEGAARHGAEPERHYARETLSAVFSGVIVPVLALALVPASRGLSLALLAWYPVKIARYARYLVRRGISPRPAWLQSAFCALGVFPQLAGIARYHAGRLSRRPSRLIEYKGPSSS
jgi:hypothetical protein